MIKHKLAGLLLLLMTLPLIATGCWNRTEPELLALVLGLGADYDRQSKQYEVVVDIANPSGMADGSNGGGGGGGQGNGSHVISARGETLFEALREIEPVLSRELFWGHSEEIIITEDLARNGIGPLFDFYARERQSRQSNFILVTDEDLKELLQLKLPLEMETGVGIRRQIQTIQKTRSVIPLADVRQALIDFNLPGKEVFVPRIRLKMEETKPEQSADEGGGGGSQGGGSQGTGGGQPQKSIEISGGAAFRGDRFAGWLEPSATKGWLFIVGGSRRATETIPCPCSGGNHFIAVEFHQANSRIEASLDKGKPKIKVTIKLEGRIEEKDFPGLFSPEYVQKLHGELVKTVREKAETAVSRAQELRSDIFGFGNAIYRRYPQEWARLEENWEEHFSRLEVEIEVNAHIRRSGLVVDPPGP